VHFGARLLHWHSSFRVSAVGWMVYQISMTTRPVSNFDSKTTFKTRKGYTSDSSSSLSVFAYRNICDICTHVLTFYSQFRLGKDVRPTTRNSRAREFGTMSVKVLLQFLMATLCLLKYGSGLILHGSYISVFL